MSNIVIFLGPPGSGKGSLSQMCLKKLGWRQLSTGALCRKHISEGTEIGKQIDFAIKSGKLVSDALIVDMVTLWLKEYLPQEKGVILDGFPRTAAQAHAFNAFINSEKQSYDVFKFAISDEKVIHRLTARYICDNNDCQAVYSILTDSQLAPKKSMICDICECALVQRSDDKPETVCKRLKTYYEHEKSLLDFYSDIDKNIEQLNVDQSLGQVYNDFIKFLDNEK